MRHPFNKEGSKYKSILSSKHATKTNKSTKNTDTDYHRSRRLPGGGILLREKLDSPKPI